MSLHEESDLSVTPANPLIGVPSVSTENLPKQPSNWLSRFSGILYTLIASFFFTCSTFTIKGLGVDLLDALILRFLLQTLITLIFAWRKNYTLLGGTAWQIFLQIMCCGTGALGFYMYFLALRYIELSDANTLSYTRVVWTVVLSVIVYRERPSIATLLALPLTFLGVTFVTQPSLLFRSKSLTSNQTSNTFRLVGFAMAFACALTSAINVLLFKQLISSSKDIKPSVLNLQFCASGLICLILNQFYMLLSGTRTLTSLGAILSWRYLVASLVCLLMIAGSVLAQKGIKREHPAIFSLLGSADIIFALILQNLFTSIRSNFYALVGSALVISSVVLIGISRIINERHVPKKLPEIDSSNEKC